MAAFISQNIIWFVIVAVFLILVIIGFIVDRAKNKKKGDKKEGFVETMANTGMVENPTPVSEPVNEVSSEGIATDTNPGFGNEINGETQVYGGPIVQEQPVSEAPTQSVIEPVAGVEAIQTPVTEEVKDIPPVEEAPMVEPIFSQEPAEAAAPETVEANPFVTPIESTVEPVINETPIVEPAPSEVVTPTTESFETPEVAPASTVQPSVEETVAPIETAVSEPEIAPVENVESITEPVAEVQIESLEPVESLNPVEETPVVEPLTSEETAPSIEPVETPDVAPANEAVTEVNQADTIEPMPQNSDNNFQN